MAKTNTGIIDSCVWGCMKDNQEYNALKTVVLVNGFLTVCLSAIVSRGENSVQDVGVPCIGNTLESSPADMDRRCQEETSKTSSYRLCHLVKWKHFQGYGFTVDSDNSGHYISTVVETSPADAAGLRHGNKVIAINGVSVESESYGGVIERILSSKEEIQILVDDNVAPAPKKTDDVTINMGIHEGGTNQNSVPTRKSADEAREFGVGFAVRNSAVEDRSLPTRKRKTVIPLPPHRACQYDQRLRSHTEHHRRHQGRVLRRIKLAHRQNYQGRVLQLLGDFKAMVGSDHDFWSSCLGKFGTGKMNEKGKRHLEMCWYHELCITKSLFQTKLQHKVSWRHPQSKHFL